MPEAIAETDRAVAHLTGDDRRVIREYYLRWAPREVIAKRLKLTLRRFDAVLNRARWRICGYLQNG
jgi:DNA-directed RNA polymerase specialized sigma24 family protein